MDSRRYLTLSNSKTLPPIPTREEVCGVNISAAGLTVKTKQLGTVPWFEPAIACLSNQSDRQAVYDVKHQAGDKHIIVEFFKDNRPIYDETGQPYAIPSVINETTPTQFRALIIEFLKNKFTPIISYHGDNGENPDDGYPNALRQLPILTELLKGLHPYIYYARLWDGVFYGATPEHIANFGVQFRKLIPNGYLTMEHNSGHIPVGNGGADWAPDGPMSTYDGIMAEFDYGNSIAPNNTLWQVGARYLGPDYRRPPDQPKDDDPSAPFGPNDGRFYLRSGAQYQGVNRGPYYPIAFEWYNIYDWVRLDTTVEDINQQRRYIRNMGWKYVG